MEPPGDLIDVRSEEPAAGFLVLRVSGELDLYTSPVLRERIRGAVTRQPRRLIVDLSGVSFFGTAGVALLLDTRKLAARAGTELWIAAPSRAAARSLELSGVSTLLNVAASLEAALSACDTPGG